MPPKNIFTLTLLVNPLAVALQEVSFYFPKNKKAKKPFLLRFSKISEWLLLRGSIHISSSFYYFWRKDTKHFSQIVIVTIKLSTCKLIFLKLESSSAKAVYSFFLKMMPFEIPLNGKFSGSFMEGKYQ